MEYPHIIIERNIPFAEGLFAGEAKVSFLSPAEITQAAMLDADALITRTRTRCDRRLLAGSRCRIIASATIGLDHVDEEWCAGAAIKVTNAPGCNAPAVAQYVLSSVISAYGMDLSGLTLGIIGVGHVGSIVERWARHLGMKVLCCDPPRAMREGAAGFCSMESIAAKADVITVHTPYDRKGRFATHHLLSDDFLQSLERAPMVINSARGPIADTEALKCAIADGKVSRAVIDCWEGEPDIDRGLLASAYIATPHIAGYSREGKIRATAMAADAVASHLGLRKPVLPVEIPGDAPEHVSARDIARSYDPMVDTKSLRIAPEAFESLRDNYNLRKEVGC